MFSRQLTVLLVAMHLLPACSRFPQLQTTARLRSAMATVLAGFGFLPPVLHPSEALAADPSKEDILLIQQAYRDFDGRRLDDADSEFTRGLRIWKELERPRDEVVSLLKARGNVRLDKKDFPAAMKDYDAALVLMERDGELADGTARYPEYPDTFGTDIYTTLYQKPEVLLQLNLYYY